MADNRLCQIFANDRGGFIHFNALTGCDSLRISLWWYTAQNYILWATFHSQNVCIFNYFYVAYIVKTRIRRNTSSCTVSKIADYWSIFASDYTLTPSLGWSRANIRIDLPLQIVRVVLPDAENRTIVSSFIWTKHQNVTDRRADRNAWSSLAITAVCIVSNADAL